MIKQADNRELTLDLVSNMEAIDDRDNQALVDWCMWNWSENGRRIIGAIVNNFFQ